jgi:hypothetical protein
MFRTRLGLERLENREAPSGIDPVNPITNPGGNPPPPPAPGQTLPPDPGTIPPTGGPIGP